MDVVKENMDVVIKAWHEVRGGGLLLCLLVNSIVTKMCSNTEKKIFLCIITKSILS